MKADRGRGPGAGQRHALAGGEVGMGETAKKANEKREPLRVRCGACGHEWTLLYTPMPVKEACRIMLNAACPMCAGKEIFSKGGG